MSRVVCEHFHLLEADCPECRQEGTGAVTAGAFRWTEEDERLLEVFESAATQVRLGETNWGIVCRMLRAALAELTRTKAECAGLAWQRDQAARAAGEAESELERREAILNQIGVRVRDYKADTDYVMTGVDWPVLLRAIEIAAATPPTPAPAGCPSCEGESIVVAGGVAAGEDSEMPCLDCAPAPAPGKLTRDESTPELAEWWRKVGEAAAQAPVLKVAPAPTEGPIRLPVRVTQTDSASCWYDLVDANDRIVGVECYGERAVMEQLATALNATQRGGEGER